MSLYTVHVYSTHRPYSREQTAQCGVSHGGRSMSREPWIKHSSTDTLPVSVNTGLKIHQILSKPKKRRSLIERSFENYSAVLSLWANIVQKFASCMQSRAAKLPRQSLQTSAASLHYTAAILSLDVIFIKYWVTCKHQHPFYLQLFGHRIWCETLICDLS